MGVPPSFPPSHVLKKKLLRIEGTRKHLLGFLAPSVPPSLLLPAPLLPVVCPHPTRSTANYHTPIEEQTVTGRKLEKSPGMLYAHFYNRRVLSQAQVTGKANDGQKLSESFPQARKYEIKKVDHSRSLLGVSVHSCAHKKDTRTKCTLDCMHFTVRTKRPQDFQELAQGVLVSIKKYWFHPGSTSFTQAVHVPVKE